MKMINLIGLIRGKEKKEIFLKELKLLKKHGDSEFIIKYFDHYQPDTRVGNCFIVLEYFQVRHFFCKITLIYLF